MNRRVLFVDEDQERNGSTVSLEYLVQGFAEAGYEVFVLTWKYQEWTRERLRRYATLIDGRRGPATMITLCVHFAYSQPLYTVAGMRYFLKDIVKYIFGFYIVRRTIRKLRPGLVYVNEYSVVQAAHAAHVCGVPVAMHIRSQMAGGAFGLRRAVVSRLVLRYSSLIIAICGREAAQLRARGEAAQKVRVVGEFVPLPVPGTVATPVVRGAFGIPPTGDVITMLGGIQALKGTLEFLTAALGVRAVRSDVVFVIAGNRQPNHNEAARAYVERCMTLVRELQQQGVCILLGTIPNPLDLIAVSDILASTSQQSHFSRPIVEAWSNALPVVAVRTPHIEELVTDGEDGLLVEARNTSALRDAFLQLLGDRAQSHRLGENGRMKMVREFDATTNLQRIIALCEGMMRS